MTSSMPAAFVLKARAELPQPEHCLHHLAEHLREDGLDLTEEGGVLIVTLPDVRGRMWCESGLLVLEAISSDAETAYFVKSWIEGALRHLAVGQPVRISWEENWKGHRLPPSFSVLKVQSLRMISRRMKRITLSCPDIERFNRNDALHLQVLVNFAALSAITNDAGARSVWRRYTVRSVDVSSGTIDVDIFMHGEVGPGALWAAALRIGDLVAVAGPSGGSIGMAARYLIAGDETALPAIARILTLLPPESKGDVLIEIGDPSDRLLLDSPEGMRLSWLNRGSEQSSIENAVTRYLTLFSDEEIFVWTGCETGVARSLRNQMKSASPSGKIDHLITGYWRRATS